MQYFYFAIHLPILDVVPKTSLCFIMELSREEDNKQNRNYYKLNGG